MGPKRSGAKAQLRLRLWIRAPGASSSSKFGVQEPSLGAGTRSCGLKTAASSRSFHKSLGNGDTSQREQYQKAGGILASTGAGNESQEQELERSHDGWDTIIWNIRENISGAAGLVNSFGRYFFLKFKLSATTTETGKYS